MVSRCESAKNDEKKQYFYEVGNFFLLRRLYIIRLYCTYVLTTDNFIVNNSK